MIWVIHVPVNLERQETIKTHSFSRLISTRAPPYEVARGIAAVIARFCPARTTGAVGLKGRWRVDSLHQLPFSTAGCQVSKTSLSTTVVQPIRVNLKVICLSLSLEKGRRKREALSLILTSFWVWFFFFLALSSNHSYSWIIFFGCVVIFVDVVYLSTVAVFLFFNQAFSILEEERNFQSVFVFFPYSFTH